MTNSPLQRIKRLLAQRHHVHAGWFVTHRATDPLLPWICYELPFESRTTGDVLVDAVCWYCQHTEEIMVRLGTIGLLAMPFSQDRANFVRRHLHGAAVPDEYRMAVYELDVQEE